MDSAPAAAQSQGDSTDGYDVRKVPTMESARRRSSLIEPIPLVLRHAPLNVGARIPSAWECPLPDPPQTPNSSRLFRSPRERPRGSMCASSRRAFHVSQWLRLR